MSCPIMTANGIHVNTHTKNISGGVKLISNVISVFKTRLRLDGSKQTADYRILCEKGRLCWNGQSFS